jgi:hypothetical protein
LDDALDAASRARWIGHAAGLSAYLGLALAGAAGDLAWVAGLRMLPVLVAVELAFGALNRGGRRLRNLAKEAQALEKPGERESRALLDWLDTLPLRAALRSLGAWLLAATLLWLFLGLSLVGVLMLVALGAVTAAQTQARLCGRLVQKALSDPDWSPPEPGLRRWPSLHRRFWTAILAPLATVLAPLALLSALGIPVELPALAALAALGGISALLWSRELNLHFSPPLRGLSASLRRMAKGDFSGQAGASGPDDLGEALASLTKASAVLARRGASLRAFGLAVDPALGAQLLDTLPAQAEERPVSVVRVVWHRADQELSHLDAPKRLAALGRFYQTVEEAAHRSGGSVLEMGGGAALLAWGAPSPEGGVLGALNAAWMLKGALGVLANQHRLRGGGSLEWSVAMASGKAASGWWGSQDRRRWTLSGGPLAEVRRLAERPGGPWLDERSASAAKAPFGVQISESAVELVAGPEAVAQTNLGFQPGERL